MNKTAKLVIDPIIRQIVDRCHVSDSNLRAIRYVISRLKNKYRTFAAMSKASRRNLMQQTIQAHKENRALYNRVMR